MNSAEKEKSSPEKITRASVEIWKDESDWENQCV